MKKSITGKISYNVPGYLVNENLPGSYVQNWKYPNRFEQEDTMKSLNILGCQVARPYTLSVGYHVTGTKNNNTQVVLNENAMVIMDRAIYEAARQGVYLIIPFINNHFSSYGTTPETSMYGDFYWFTKTLVGINYTSQDSFFKNDKVISLFLDFVEQVMNRKNSISGIKYANDPTILAWETGNELGGWNSTPPVEWTNKVYDKIKSIQKNVLVLDGSIASWNSQTKCELVGTHYYPGSPSQVKKDIERATSAGKGFILGEIGFDTPENLLKTCEEAAKLGAISLIWSLRPHYRNGGCFVHRENDTYNAYHIPGWNNSSVVKPFSNDSWQLSKGISKLNQNGPPKSVIGQKPTSIIKVSSTEISWRGVAGARQYSIYYNNNHVADATDRIAINASGPQNPVLYKFDSSFSPIDISKVEIIVRT